MKILNAGRFAFPIEGTESFCWMLHSYKMTSSFLLTEASQSGREKDNLNKDV